MKTVLFILSSVPHPDAKIGRRQAVMIEDAEIAALLLAWAAEVRAAEGETARLFPNPPQLRAALKRALAVFDAGAWDTRCLLCGTASAKAARPAPTSGASSLPRS